MRASRMLLLAVAAALLLPATAVGCTLAMGSPPGARDAPMDGAARSTLTDAVDPEGGAAACPLSGNTATLLLDAVMASVRPQMAVLGHRPRTPTDVLASETRRRMLRAVEDTPGIHIQELAARMNLQRTAVIYHADILGRAGLVRLVPNGKFVCAYAASARAVSWAPLVPSIATDPIISESFRGGPITREDMHRVLGGTPLRTRNYRIKRLIDLGALVCADPRGDRFQLDSELRQFLSSPGIRLPEPVAPAASSANAPASATQMAGHPMIDRTEFRPPSL